MLETRNAQKQPRPPTFFIELIAAFTILGYMIAEMRGRKNESAGKTFAWVLITALVASVIIIMLKGLPALFFFSLIETVLISAASLYGAVIYRLQLSSIRNLWFKEVREN